MSPCWDGCSCVAGQEKAGCAGSPRGSWLEGVASGNSGIIHGEGRSGSVPLCACTLVCLHLLFRYVLRQGNADPPMPVAETVYTCACEDGERLSTGTGQGS